MNAYIGIITCIERGAELSETLCQLSEVGLSPDQTLSSPCAGSIEDNRYKAYHLANRAYALDWGLLFLEDDIDVAPTFSEFLRRAVAHNRLTTFSLLRNSLYPQGYESRRRFMAAKDPRGYLGELVRLPDAPVQARRGFHGSQAVYLPPEMVQALVEAREDFVDDDESRYPPGTVRHGFDFWVKDNVHRFGGLYAAHPNPVQHRSPPSTFGGKGVFQSDSYGLDTYFEGD